MRSKAQISAEFFVFLGLAFLIAIAFELASLDQLNDFRLQKENEAVKDLALKLQQELLIASTVEDGYVRVFEIPNSLDNVNYSLTTLKNNTITVESKNAFYIVPIPRAIGNASKGTNVINKTGGVIYINNKIISFFADSNICQNAQNLGLCSGLDIIYGIGYQASCCSEHSLCC
ncbi:hypothetical protein HYX05_05420 [Candidatus Woesearchaeota archaeon]|nr:hypothetical protein [Candidatus Woesearchaeota archaeon]